MKNLTIVTGFSLDGYKLYGKNCINSIVKYWPKDIKILAYVEKYHSDMSCRASQIKINHVDGLFKFLKYAKDKPEIKGEKYNKLWKEKELKNGYSYRFDAYKFCKMAFYTRDAANSCKTKYLLWLDGDTVTFNDVPENFIRAVLPDGKICSYLGRENKHSECGFILFKLPEALDICNRWAEFYETLTVFTLKEWHSSYVFDKVIESIDQNLLHNMTPKGKGHVWFQSPLCRYIDHLKGDRKKIGHSKECYK